jgi:hypothetical protein
MKKYSEIAPLVKRNLKEIGKETDRSFEMKNIEDVLKRYSASSISELPLDIKAKIINGETIR